MLMLSLGRDKEDLSMLCMLLSQILVPSNTVSHLILIVGGETFRGEERIEQTHVDGWLDYMVHNWALYFDTPLSLEMFGYLRPWNYLFFFFSHFISLSTVQDLFLPRDLEGKIQKKIASAFILIDQIYD